MSETKQPVMFTISLEDQGQDFTEIDVLENGVIRGNSIMFSDNRLSFLGAGTLNGTVYIPFEELDWDACDNIIGAYVYMYDTAGPRPLPWNARSLNYKITGIKQGKN